MPKLKELSLATQKLVEDLQFNISVEMERYTEEENEQIEQDFIRFDLSELYVDGGYYLAGLLDEIEETKDLNLYEDEEEMEYFL